MKLKIKRLSSEAKIPTKANGADAGYDLYAVSPIVLDPMQRALVFTGIALEIPSGFYGRIAPRSGLALKGGIDVLGGVIDSGYRSEIGVILVNLNLPDVFHKQARAAAEHYIMFGSRNRLSINKGDRIAQIIIEKCHDVEFEEVEDLAPSERGETGYGDSGE